ncbi:MAG: glycosyltransferase family 2 protein [Marinilabiliaceae bacterium]|mgnify:CR=1 FL=1|nr:glycosyltransferase family 2 protein [Marinilabiliaceae bacterium]
MQETKPYISVIIPVYNVAFYLRRCLDSLLCQTYTDFELLLVDDGSDDGSGAICDEYASRDARIRVVHKENGGASSARNVAIDIAEGSYIVFVDADDAVVPDYLKIMLEDAQRYDADVAITDFRMVYGDKLSAEKGDKRGRERKLTPAEAIEKMLYQDGIKSNPFAKLFRRALFDEIRYREGILFEDLEILPRLFEKARVVVYNPVVTYYYCYRKDSSIGTFTTKSLSVLSVTRALSEKYQSDSRLSKAAHDRELSANFNIFMLMIRAGYPLKDATVQACWREIREKRLESLLNPRVRVKNKIGSLISYLGATVLSAVCRMTKG